MLERSFLPPKNLKGEKRKAWLRAQAKIERGIVEGILNGTMQQLPNGLFAITEKGVKLNEQKKHWNWRNAA